VRGRGPAGTSSPSNNKSFDLLPAPLFCICAHLLSPEPIESALNMPRDLLAEKSLEGMRQLSKEFAAANPPPKKRNANPYGTALVRVEDPFKKMDKKNIKPFSSLLSIDDLDDCDWLEHAAFDPIEAATREKVSDVSFHPSSAMDTINT
jgi:hypothetical protein